MPWQNTFKYPIKGDMLKHKISLFIITKILHYDLLILNVYKSFIF